MFVCANLGLSVMDGSHLLLAFNPMHVLDVCIFLLVQHYIPCLIEIHPGAWRTRAAVWKAGTTGSYAQSLCIICHSHTVFCICKMAIFVHVAARLFKKILFLLYFNVTFNLCFTKLYAGNRRP